MGAPMYCWGQYRRSLGTRCRSRQKGTFLETLEQSFRDISEPSPLNMAFRAHYVLLACLALCGASLGQPVGPQPAAGAGAASGAGAGAQGEPCRFIQGQGAVGWRGRPQRHANWSLGRSNQLQSSSTAVPRQLTLPPSHLCCCRAQHHPACDQDGGTAGLQQHLAVHACEHLCLAKHHRRRYPHRLAASGAGRPERH
jgi:hypothetical protein